MEAVIMVGVLRRAGAAVTVASVEEQLEVEDSCGTKLIADELISSCSTEIFNLVAVPGGMPGSARLRYCKILPQITSEQAEEKRLYGAICAAPAVTLLPWGLLRRRQVIIPVANGSEEIELVTVIDVPGQAKGNVIVASVDKSLQILASNNVKIIVDMMISEAAYSIYDLIILPGGKSGAERLSKSRILKKLQRDQESAGRFLGAISSILQKHGLLKDKLVDAGALNQILGHPRPKSYNLLMKNVPISGVEKQLEILTV